MNAGLVEIAQEMVILFFIIGIGYIAKKSKLMTEEFDRSLSKLIVNIALPGMILGSVLTAENLPGLEDIILTFHRNRIHRQKIEAHDRGIRSIALEAHR